MSNAPNLPEPSLDLALRTLLRSVVRDVVREEIGVVAQAAAPDPRTTLREYLSTGAAAALTGVADKTVRGWVHGGKLRGHWAGRFLRIERSELEDFMKLGLATTESDLSADEVADKILNRRRRAPRRGAR
jgi:excisionase family DNA binding protein